MWLDGKKLDADKELDRLFQRVNFFLIGTAFLITAFVALVSSEAFGMSLHSHSYNLLILAHSVGAAGFYLALFFAVMNYCNARVNQDVSEGKESGYSVQSLVASGFRDFGASGEEPLQLCQGATCSTHMARTWWICYFLGDYVAVSGPIPISMLTIHYCIWACLSCSTLFTWDLDGDTEGAPKLILSTKVFSAVRWISFHDNVASTIRIGSRFAAPSIDFH